MEQRRRSSALLPSLLSVLLTIACAHTSPQRRESTAATADPSETERPETPPIIAEDSPEEDGLTKKLDDARTEPAADAEISTPVVSAPADEASVAPAPPVGSRAGAGGYGSAGHRTMAKDPGLHRKTGRRPRKKERRSPSSSSVEGAISGRAPAPRDRSITAPAMKAGRHDDNTQYNRFLQFLRENKRQVVYPQDISERIVLRTVDKNGESLFNCRVEVRNLAGKILSTTTTFADGRTLFFPSAHAKVKDYTINARCGDSKRQGQLQRYGKRHVDIGFNTVRTLPKRAALDIAIIIDTTGSMSNQIERLKKTLRAIHFQLSETQNKPDIRFGLVAYRDKGDDYRTKLTPFTNDVNQFQQALNLLDANGGGDTPEDLQEALKVAMTKLEWRPNALRLGFAISDAIPHTDYDQSYDYKRAMTEGLGRAIKWTMIGAGGLGRDGEVIFRQIAQYTMGEYVFVTQGAGGDHEGSRVEASHHVGANYKTENLDQALVRIVRRELSYLTATPRDFDNTIIATGTKGTPRDLVLAPAVKEVMRQLVDYSAMKIEAHTPLAVFPVSAPKTYAAVSEYLSEQFILEVSRNQSFRVVERDLKALNHELKLQLSEMFDVRETVPIGKMTGAEILLVAKLSVVGKGVDLFAKLVRVATGEVLAVAKASLRGGIVDNT